MNKKILITGGAGFIGANLSANLLQAGNEVFIYDNLSRKGTEKNISWLKSFNKKLNFINADVKDYNKLKEVVKKVDAVFHLAAQVAVTTSCKNPRNDFKVNALGAFNVLEAVRNCNANVPIIFTSTNKVYGELKNVKVIEKKYRYEFIKFKKGINENIGLDFHSPYGCSKGCADQYFIDYARIYGLKTLVFRMSCIYGTRQFGNEDQGWVAHFIISSLLGKKLTIYGDGKQIRDILYIKDLIKLFKIGLVKINKLAGEVFNVGGGYKNTISLLELINFISNLTGKKISLSFSKMRPGDQKVYVSDITKIKKFTGWAPEISTTEGIKKLYQWVKKNKELFY